MFNALGLKNVKILISILLFSFCSSIGVAQVTIISDNFNDGNITSNPTWSNNTSAFTVSNTSALEGSHSLRSNTGNTVSSIYTQFATNTNLTTANYTWNLLYRANTNSNPDELPYGDAITTNKNHWRFWIAANSNNASTCHGFYVSHSAGNLKFARKKNNGTWDIATYPISLNTTYSIKITRRYDGYFDFYVDAGTAEATTIRWSGYATDVFNSGSSDIYMIMHANETSANRFQWDNAGMFSKNITISQLTNGVYTGDLEEGLTNKAVMGFAATTIGSITLEEVRINTSANNNQGTFTNLKLVKSVDNDFSTAGDNTVVNGISFVLNGDHVVIDNINSTINTSTENYFFVLDVVNNNGGSPPANIQFSMSCVDCGVPYTNIVTTNAEKVNDFSFTGPVYQMVRVFTWKNTTIVGDFTDNWQNSSAWEPFRTNPSANDILQFSKGGTVNPLNIPTQSFKKISIKNNTTVNITTSSLTNGSATLTVVGGSDDDFIIESGSTLNVTSTGNNFTVSMPNGTTASISGNVNLSGKTHQLNAATSSGIQFKNGSVFTGGTGLLGNPFGSTTTASVNFESGATLIDQAGLDYFTSANVLNMSSGSVYRHSASTTAVFTSRTFNNFEISSGATFAIAAGTLNILGDISGAGTLTSTSGVLNLSGNFAHTGTFTPGTGTVNYVGNNQNVKATNYFNINFSNGGNKTLLGNINFATGGAATFVLDESVILSCSTYTITASTASSTININGYLITSNTNGLSGSTSTTLRSTNSPTIALGTNSTIEYNSSATQAVSARSDYKNIKATGSGTKNAGALTLTGDLNIGDGVIFSMGTNLLNGIGSTSGTGTFRTSNTSTTPVPANMIWNFPYDANGGNQSIVAGTYSDLLITGSNTKTARGNVNVSGKLTINASRTFTMGTFLLLSVGSTEGTGTLRTDNTSASPIPSGVNWTYTVLYNGANQTVVQGNYTNLTLAGSGTKTTNTDITVSAILNVASGVILDVQSNLITGFTSTTGTGRLKTANTSSQPLPSNFEWLFTVEYYATSATQTVVPGDYTSLTISGARGANNINLANNGTIYLSGTLTASATFSGGSYNLTGNTFVFDGAAQNIPAFTFNNLNIEGTGDKTASANFGVNGDLFIASGRVLIMSTRQLTSIGTTSGTGTLRTSYTSANPLPANSNWNFTVEYSTNSSQSVVGGTYSNLTILGTKGSNNVTFVNGSTINITGVFNPAATFTTGTYIVTNNTVQFTGGTQNIPAFKFNNLNIQGNGDKTIAGNVEVNGTLTLDENELLLSNSDLTLNGSIAYTNGNLRGGTCGAPTGNLVIKGTGALGQLKVNENSNFINNITIDRNGNAELNSDINISGSLILTQGILISNKKISFNTANNPIIKANGTITLQADATLEFGSCDFSGNNFTIPNDVFTTPPTFKNLTIGRTNGVVVGNQMLSITGTIKINAGTLNANDKITLVSNAAGTARVDSIVCNGCNIIGNLTAQRFIPGGEGKRRWRLLASPANQNGSTSITQIIDDILVTGDGGSSNGFDDSPNNNYSIKIYNETLPGSSSVGWEFPANVNTTYPAGKGICVFVRGDRFTQDPYLNWATANDATLNYNGTLTIGDFNLPLTYTNNNSSADGWNLVSNPYASTIDWNKDAGWIKNNIQTKVWLYNPATGSYGTYDANLDIGTNQATPFIASGQGFFVKATGANPQLTIKERAKVDSIPSNFFRAKSVSNILRIVLHRDSINSDEAILHLNSTASGDNTDPSDASKFFNDNMNFYLKSDNGYNLIIDEHPLPEGPDTIKASVFSYSGTDIWTGSYMFEFKGIESLFNNVDVYFEDTYANKKINIREINTYNFEILNNPESMGNDRFRIILGKNNNPVGIDDIKNDGKNFIVYPNPFNQNINVKLISNGNAEKVTYSIFNQVGQEISSGQLTLDHNNSVSINTEELSKGLYYIRFKGAANSEVIKLIKN